MKQYAIHVCSFDSTGDMKGKALTYENIKAVVLAAGRFSDFEATQTRRHIALFTELIRDPQIEVFKLDYPWIGVRLKGGPS